MNKVYWFFDVLFAIILFITACSAKSTQTDQSTAQAVDYRSVLGQSRDDKEVINFLAENNCIQVGPFYTCKEAGVALWLDPEQIVRTIYLYLNNKDGFSAYRGELPFGLKFYDTLGAVEYKLNRQGVGNNGLPDETAVPDHMHYWAFYKQAGITIIYNAPFPDEDATIYAILVTS